MYGFNIIFWVNFLQKSTKSTQSKNIIFHKAQSVLEPKITVNQMYLYSQPGS